jgi:hypothetical protein
MENNFDAKELKDLGILPVGETVHFNMPCGTFLSVCRVDRGFLVAVTDKENLVLPGVYKPLYGTGFKQNAKQVNLNLIDMWIETWSDVTNNFVFYVECKAIPMLRMLLAHMSKNPDRDRF